MLESVLNIYYRYPEKKCLTKFADAILYPTSYTFCGKRYDFVSSDKKFVRIEDEKSHSLFIKVILAVTTVLILPLTLIACVIKLTDKQNRELHKEVQETDSKQKPKESKAPETPDATPKRDESVGCNVCADTEEFPEITVLSCDHAFHTICIKKWHAAKKPANCPSCRALTEDTTAPAAAPAPVQNNFQNGPAPHQQFRIPPADISELSDRHFNSIFGDIPDPLQSLPQPPFGSTFQRDREMQQRLEELQLNILLHQRRQRDNRSGYSPFF